MSSGPASLAGGSPVGPTLRQKVWGWVLDYWYLAYWMVRGIFARSTPVQLLHPPTGPCPPVLLIPGVYENWRFMQPIAEDLYRSGHPVHVLDKLGYNVGAIPKMALVVSEYLERSDLHDVTVIGHSKGGLIGKFVLADLDPSRRIKHVIAINTPFSGSRYASLFLLRSVRMFAPSGAVIRQLTQNAMVNKNISSLYSIFDPHLPETSRLGGAENIVLPSIGHFRPIGDAETLSIIRTIVKRT